MGDEEDNVPLDSNPNCPNKLSPQQATEPFSSSPQDSLSPIPRFLARSCGLATAASYSNVMSVIESPIKIFAPSPLAVMFCIPTPEL